MQLKHLPPRRALIALGVSAAVVATGVTVGATMASADVTALTLTPNVSDITILDYPAATDDADALTAYGLKPGGYSNTADKVWAEVLTGTALSGTPAIKFGKTAANVALTAATAGLAAKNVGEVIDTGSTGTATDDLWISSAVPGSYTVRFYQDHNNNGVFDSGIDQATPTITVTVKDATNATASASGYAADDWAPTVTVPSTVDIGRAVDAAATTGGLTTTDIRGRGRERMSVCSARRSPR